MSSLINLGWAGKSIIAMACFVPFVLMFNFFEKNYGMKPEALMCAWFVGTAIGVTVSVGIFGVFDISDFYTPLGPLTVVVALGVILGTPAIICLSQAISEAPNPALPLTIAHGSRAIAYVLATFMGVWFSGHFDKMQFNKINFVGVLLVVLGLGLVIYRTN